MKFFIARKAFQFVQTDNEMEGWYLCRKWKKSIQGKFRS